MVSKLKAKVVPTIGLILAIFAWALVVFSIVGVTVDLNPPPGEDEMRWINLLVPVVLFSCLACLVISSWIGGLAYREARKRSLAIGLLNAMFLIAVLGFLGLNFYGL